MSTQPVPASPLRVRITEIGPGRWRAAIDGEEEGAVVEPTGDEALARLIRSRMARFGVAEITYASDPTPAPAPASSRPLEVSKGHVVAPNHVAVPGRQVAEGK